MLHHRSVTITADNVVCARALARLPVKAESAGDVVVDQGDILPKTTTGRQGIRYKPERETCHGNERTEDAHVEVIDYPNTEFRKMCVAAVEAGHLTSVVLKLLYRHSANDYLEAEQVSVFDRQEPGDHLSGNR